MSTVNIAAVGNSSDVRIQKVAVPVRAGARSFLPSATQILLCEIKNG